jgi:hypothetical protein
MPCRRPAMLIAANRRRAELLLVSNAAHHDDGSCPTGRGNSGCGEEALAINSCLGVTGVRS